MSEMQLKTGAYPVWRDIQFSKRRKEVETEIPNKNR